MERRFPIHTRVAGIAGVDQNQFFGCRNIADSLHQLSKGNGVRFQFFRLQRIHIGRNQEIFPILNDRVGGNVQDKKILRAQRLERANLAKNRLGRCCFRQGQGLDGRFFIDSFRCARKRAGNKFRACRRIGKLEPGIFAFTDADGQGGKRRPGRFIVGRHLPCRLVALHSVVAVHGHGFDDVFSADHFQRIGLENRPVRLLLRVGRTTVHQHCGPVQIKTYVADAAALLVKAQADLNLFPFDESRGIHNSHFRRLFDVRQFRQISQGISRQRTFDQFGAIKRFPVIFDAVNRVSDANVEVAVSPGRGVVISFGRHDNPSAVGETDELNNLFTRGKIVFADGDPVPKDGPASV